LIYATGAQAKWLGIPSEEIFRGFGVSACASCDGFFFRDKRVAIVGGGNTAVEEALYLANIASAVTLIHRRDTLRAERMLQDRLFAHPKISIRRNSEVASIIGEEKPAKANGIIIRSCLDNNLDRLDIDGVFVAIGPVRLRTASFAARSIYMPTDTSIYGLVRPQPACPACLLLVTWRMASTARP
jgi:thioredoxin reductase (NADPH)